MPNTKPVSIILAEDHPVFRKGLKDILAEKPGFRVVGETGVGSEVEGLAEELRPDVVLLDLNLPGKDGLMIAHDLMSRESGIRIVVLTMHREEAMFNRAMDIGVHGYVLKESAVQDIIESVRAVTRGEYFISPAISGYLVRRNEGRKALRSTHPSVDTLTPAEQRILHLVAANRSSKEIAGILFLSVRTVENHRQNISNKLGLRGSNSLLRFALENRSRL
jgi:DNA-binding NarL/FixJ family response regulator